MRNTIYLSYSGRNCEAVLQLMEAVIGAGYVLSCDCLLPANEPFQTRVRRAMDDAALVLAVITEDAADCSFMDAELEYALASGKRLLPVAVADAALPVQHRGALEALTMCRISKDPADGEVPAVMAAVKRMMEA